MRMRGTFFSRRGPFRGGAGGALALALATLGCTPAVGVPSSGAGPAPAAASELHGRLAAIFGDPVLAHAHIGVLFRSLDTGETLFELNPDRMFIPASNVKLLSGAAALMAMGPEYRYRTTVSLGGPVR
jgi:D-alanyl-D-alanine carboxypeptidase/D-alanyl-D-alanine-endopeptidase (penicillin-binding protein 4)